MDGQPRDEAAGDCRPGWVSILQQAVPVLVLLALVCHPTQVTVRQWASAAARLLGFGEGLARSIPSVRVTVSDVLIVGAFVLWTVLNILQRRLWERLRRYPPALLAFLAVAALSVMPFLKPSGTLAGGQMLYGRAFKELVQLIILLVCAYLVLADYLRDAVWRPRLAAGFLGAAALAICVGLAEYARLRPAAPQSGVRGAIISPVEVDGTFGFRSEAAGPHEQIGTSSNRHVLGAWVSLIVPLFWALALCLPKPVLKVACGAAAVAGQVLLLQGGLWVFTLAALLAVAFVRRRQAFLVTAAVLFVFWAALFRFAPQQHGMVLMDSLMLRKSYDRFYALPLYGDNAALNAPGREAALNERDNSVWQQKYVEWQAGWQAVARNPLFGVGLGNYQNHINYYYAASEDSHFNPRNCYLVVKPSRNLMETGANSLCLVWLVETGFAGLFALVWLFLFGLTSSAFAYRAVGDGLRRGLALGSLGAVGAMAGGMLFTNYLVRGVGIAVVFVLAAAAGLREAAGPTSHA